MIVQFGGQTPLNLALPLKAAGVPIIGTSPESSISPKTASALASCWKSWRIPQPAARTATRVDEALGVNANRICYPGAGAAIVRAGRARDGDGLRRRVATRT